MPSPPWPFNRATAAFRCAPLDLRFSFGRCRRVGCVGFGWTKTALGGRRMSPRCRPGIVVGSRKHCCDGMDAATRSRRIAYGRTVRRLSFASSEPAGARCWGGRQWSQICRLNSSGNLGISWCTVRTAAHRACGAWGCSRDSKTDEGPAANAVVNRSSLNVSPMDSRPSESPVPRSPSRSPSRVRSRLARSW